jgi:polyhydroxybutyrate depolymerase
MTSLARLVALSLLLAACAPVDEAGGDPESDLPARTFPDAIGGERPAPVLHPTSLDPDETLPAVVLLHGYGVNAQLEDGVFGLQRRLDRDRFLLVMPEGRVDDHGAQFWNAGVDCCGEDGPPVDDVAYLSGLVDELRATWRVGTVAFVGHSNGGYMAYRLACERPGLVDRMAVLAGAAPIDPSGCVDGPPVALLHVHGDADDTVPYEAATAPHPTPGAVASTAWQAARNGCATTSHDVGSADLLGSVDGAESTGVTWDRCGASTALWTVHDGDHLFLTATEAFRDGVTAFALGADPTF